MAAGLVQVVSPSTAGRSRSRGCQVLTHSSSVAWQFRGQGMATVPECNCMLRPARVSKGKFWH